ncbi:YusW family protein [Siminovitchia acidinfaciens]|nr:YusW family protein [Siminovitchia acidinfaciens]
MKKWIYFFSIPLLALGMTACSNDPSVDNHPKEQVVPPPNENATTNDDLINKEDSGNKSDDGNVADMNAKKLMDNFPYRKFDLEIVYAPDMEYDFEYEEKNAEQGQYRAELNDSVHDKKLKGVEAFQTLYTLMQDVRIDENTTKEDAIQQIFDAFQLDTNYTKFELDYTMKNGKEIEFEDVK